MQDLISDWDLFDIKPTKGHFTWTNRRSGINHIAARLERLLVSSDLMFQDKEESPLQLLPLVSRIINQFLSLSKTLRIMGLFRFVLILSGCKKGRSTISLPQLGLSMFVVRQLMFGKPSLKQLNGHSKTGQRHILKLPRLKKKISWANYEQCKK